MTSQKGYIANVCAKMGKCQSKKKQPLPNIRIELEKTLQQCIHEKDDYKEKYEECNRRYEHIKSQLEKSLRTVKTLQRKLKISEENASTLYRRYAIESDLNRRLKNKTSTEYDRADALSWKFTDNTSYDFYKRLDDFESRLQHLEMIIDLNDSC